MLCAWESRRADIHGGNTRCVPCANVVVEVRAFRMRAPIVGAHGQLAKHVCERCYARNVPLTDRTVRCKPRRRVNAPQVNCCLQLRPVRKAVGGRHRSSTERAPGAAWSSPGLMAGLKPGRRDTGWAPMWATLPNSRPSAGPRAPYHPVRISLPPMPTAGAQWRFKMALGALYRVRAPEGEVVGVANAPSTAPTGTPYDRPVSCLTFLQSVTSLEGTLQQPHSRNTNVSQKM